MTDDNELISRFCKTFNLTLESPEPYRWIIDQYTLYSPKHEDLLGSGHPEAWDICSIKVHPGVHTMPNGDPGYPDEAEEVLVDSQLNLLSALERLGQLIIRDWIDTEQQASEHPESGL